MKIEWSEHGQYEREILERERQILLGDYRSIGLDIEQARRLDYLNRQLGGTGDEIRGRFE